MNLPSRPAPEPLPLRRGMAMGTPCTGTAVQGTVRTVSTSSPILLDLL